MDKQKLCENVEQYLIGLDEEFRFKCRECGKCCKNRDDILLSPLDIYKMIRKLKLSSLEFLSRYCESYIGGSSRIPIVRLKPSGVNKVCPLLKNNHCMVHDSKPAVCAMYPIGRFFGEEDERGIRIMQYLKMPVDCASLKHKHTVRTWLERFAMDHDANFSSRWFSLVAVLSSFIYDRESRTTTPTFTRDSLWSFLEFMLYINYDSAGDFHTQFTRNMVEVEQLLHANDRTFYEKFRKINEHFSSSEVM